ncbi:MAG: NF038129 family PEP-CTERM protein, partial [Massilia sp.]
MLLKSIFTRALLALAVAGAAAPAVAGPLYHVAIDTRSLSGDAYLDLTFTALSGAAPATASVSNFVGVVGADRLTQGMVGGVLGSTVTFGNQQTFNELLQQISLGSILSFDLAFSESKTGAIGTDFGVALVSAALDDYLAGTSGSFIVIGLLPGKPDTVSVSLPFATVTAIAAVPEPAGAALFVGGLLLMGIVSRRRASAEALG